MTLMVLIHADKKISENQQNLRYPDSKKRLVENHSKK